MVLVSSIWIRRRSGKVELLVELEPGEYSLIAKEWLDEDFSHCISGTGILKGVPDTSDQGPCKVTT